MVVALITHQSYYTKNNIITETTTCLSNLNSKNWNIFVAAEHFSHVHSFPLYIVSKTLIGCQFGFRFECAEASSELKLALLHIASSSGEEADEGDDAILNEAMQVRFHLHIDCTAHD